VADLNILKGGNPAVYAHGANLGQDGRSGHPNLSKDTVDAVTFNDAGHSNKHGLESVSFDWTGLYTASAGRSYNVVKDMFGDSTGNASARVVSYYPEGSVIRDKQGIGLDKVTAFSVTQDGGPGDLLELSAGFDQSGTSDFITGVIGTTYTANTTSAAATMGASSTAGGRYYLHILNASMSGGNEEFDFKIEHASATNQTYVTATGASLTVASAQSNGTVFTSSGQLRAFVRVVVTRDASSGSVEFVLGAYRV
jgi:hypothetical protein